MIDIGRICVKLAGRDAGKKCVIIDVLDNKTVLIDGETRRRKCNIMHLAILDETVDLSKNASHEAVCKALGAEAKESKKRAKTERPKQIRKKKSAAEGLEEKTTKKKKKEQVKKEKTEKAKGKAEKEKKE
jgi:large subunit ribosomal protein L14e